MPALDTLNHASRDEFVAVLGPLFEHSPWIAAETWARRPFRDAAHLHAELCATLRTAPRERQLALILAHPDLAGRLAREGQLTSASKGEQASAGLNRLTDAEREQFEALNQAYRSRFGFPFIICARLNSRDAIVTAMQRRVTHEPEVEFDTALAEIEKIARLRLDDTLARA